jgi:hypothetical protein
VTSSLRTIVLGALKQWGCMFREIDPNRLLVFITAGSPLEKICECSGEVIIALNEFEGGDAGPKNQFDFVAGSIYLSRLLREIQAGPAIACLDAEANNLSPSSGVIGHLASRFFFGELVTDDCLVGEVEWRPALAFHFVLLLRGLHFVEHFFTVTVDAHSGAPLNGLPLDAPFVPSARGGVDPDQVAESFRAAVALARESILVNLEAYRKRVSPEIERTVRTVRKLVRQEIEVRRQRRRGEAAKVEIESALIEENAHKEIEAIRRQGFARSADLALVAVTMEWRPVRGCLFTFALGQGHHAVNLIFDCAGDNLHAPRCEDCEKPMGLLRPGESPCSHLLCDECHKGSCGYHSVCRRCSRTCSLCARPFCDRCVGQSQTGCNHSLCGKHITKCLVVGCDTWICPICMPRCVRCRGVICPLHVVRCQNCDSFVCPEHMSLGQHGRRCEKVWVKQRTKLLVTLARDAFMGGGDVLSDRLLAQDSSGEWGQAVSLLFGEAQPNPEIISRGIKLWFRPVDISITDEGHVFGRLERMQKGREAGKHSRSRALHLEERRGKRWFNHRVKLLLELASGALLYGLDDALDQLLRMEGADETDASSFRELLHSYIARKDDVRMRLRNWFKASRLSWQEEDRVLDDLRRVEFGCAFNDVSPFAVPNDDDLEEEVSLLKQERGLRGLLPPAV